MNGDEKKRKKSMRKAMKMAVTWKVKRGGKSEQLTYDERKV